MNKQEAQALANELLTKADALAEVCSRITGIPFDPEDEDTLTLDTWVALATTALEEVAAS